MGRLDGKIAVITGAGTGIGRASFELFAREGARVVGAGRTLATLEETLETVREAGGEGFVVRADVSSEEDCRRLIQTAVERYGGLDVLVNNAGVGWQYRETHPQGMDPVETTPSDFWNEVLSINLSSVFYLCKHAIPILRERGGGSVVNVSSTGGIRGMVDAHAYAAAKAGMNNLTRSMAKTYGPQGIRFNVVAPGITDTQMVRSYMAAQGDPHLDEEGRFLVSPMGRAGRPEEVATVCLFLSSDEASYVNGVVVPVDGGASC